MKAVLIALLFVVFLSGPASAASLHGAVYGGGKKVVKAAVWTGVHAVKGVWSLVKHL